MKTAMLGSRQRSLAFDKDKSICLSIGTFNESPVGIEKVRVAEYEVALIHNLGIIRPEIAGERDFPITITSSYSMSTSTVGFLSSFPTYTVVEVCDRIADSIETVHQLAAEEAADGTIIPIGVIQKAVLLLETLCQPPMGLPKPSIWPGSGLGIVFRWSSGESHLKVEVLETLPHKFRVYTIKDGIAQRGFTTQDFSKIKDAWQSPASPR